MVFYAVLVIVAQDNSSRWGSFSLFETTSGALTKDTFFCWVTGLKLRAVCALHSKSFCETQGIQQDTISVKRFKNLSFLLYLQCTISSQFLAAHLAVKIENGRSRFSLCCLLPWVTNYLPYNSASFSFHQVRSSTTLTMQFLEKTCSPYGCKRILCHLN